MAAPQNNKGYKSDKQWRNAIQLAVHRLATDGKTKHLDLLAMRLVKAGAEGDVSALREIGDRLDGKPVQEMDVTHDGAVTIQSAAISILDAIVAGTAEWATGPAPSDTLPN